MQTEQLLERWENGDKMGVLKEAFPDRAERALVMELLTQVAFEHKVAHKAARLVWFAVGFAVALAIGGAVKVFS